MESNGLSNSDEKRLAQYQAFIQALVRWAADQPDLKAVVLVGSYARQSARADSDIDLVLLVTDPAKYLKDVHWAARFGSIARFQVEDYVKVTSLRVWYADGPEVEFGLTTPDWVARPLDEGTRRVLADGMQTLFDRNDLFANLDQELHR
jgi:predicted nucleotidyltransferase